MKIDKKIGIVGKGFVGTAVQFGFSPSVGVDADVAVLVADVPVVDCVLVVEPAPVTSANATPVINKNIIKNFFMSPPL